MCQSARHDDPTIPDEERLFRRVHLCQIVKDENTGFARVSSGAFRDKDKEISINIESVLKANDGTPETCLRNHPACKLIYLTAGQARELEQAVCRDPKPPADLSHGLVCGKQNTRVLHELRDAAEWVIPREAPLYTEIEEAKRALGIPG